MVKKKHALALFPLALCFSSPVVLAAATTTELEQRLQEQEKKILRLENQLKGTRAAVKEDRTRINEMQERLRINGFLSAGVAQNDGDQVEDSFYGVSDNYSTAVVNKLGVQMTFQVSEDFSATAQLVSKGTKDYNVEAEWAYLTYQATNSLRFNIGRQRLPYYLLSEYLDVGYALPWVLPPIELYNIPLSATDGISALYDFSAGPVNFTWQTYAGMNSGFSEQLDADFRSNQSWGSNIVAEWGALTMRVGYSAARLTASPVEGGSGDQLISAIETAQNELVPALAGLGVSVAPGQEWLGTLEDLNTDYISFGFMYDDGNLLVLGEIANLSVDDTVQPVGDAGYLTVGYRFGKWMPHITYAKFQTDAKNDKQVRQMQEYADSVGRAAYNAALGLNASLNTSNQNISIGAPLGSGATVAGAPPAGVGGTAANFVSTTTCTAAAVFCSADALTIAGVRDSMLTAAAGYSESLYNTLEGQIQEQQSVTLGLTYDVSPRVKAKAQVTHYEGFGEGNYQSLGSASAPLPLGGPNFLPTTQYSGFSTTNIDGNGRFIGEPGATGNHTAIYSFSIDAVF
jgi:hypothetical protein